MAKKRGRKDVFETDIPVRGMSREFENLIYSTDPDALKSRIIETPREVLDRWVEEISGNRPDETHDDAFVAAALCRYIDGDKNWGDDPRRVDNLSRKRKATTEEGNQAEQPEEITHAPAEDLPSQEEEEMSKPIQKKKEATKKSTPPKKKKVSKPPKSPSEKKESTRLIGKTTGKTRMAWFLNALKENFTKKLSDEKIDTLAAHEFGLENIPGKKGTFCASHMRGSFNSYRKCGRYGLSMSDPEFLSYNKEK